MGLFRKDPAQLLARAEELIGRQQAVRAIEVLEALREDPSPDVRGRAAALEERAHAAVVEGLLERAEEAAADGDPATAADWLASALVHCRDDEQRKELEGRRESLLARAGEKREVGAGLRVWVPPPLDLDLEPDEGTAGDQPPGAYDLLVATLTEEAVPRYAARPRLFQEACLAIRGGLPAVAGAALDTLLAAAPEEPVYRLERARCGLLLGDAAGAREDLDAVWPILGDAPLDRGGRLSVPALWAEAMLDLGEPQPIVERLGGLVDGGAGEPHLTSLYATALTETGEAEAARELLAQAAGFYPDDGEIAYRLAHLQAERGEADESIAILERLVAPEFDGSQRPPNLPVLRLLASLYLDHGGPLDVVGGLLKRSIEGREDRLGSEDLHLLGRYQQEIGDPEGARRSTAAAERLEARQG